MIQRPLLTNSVVHFCGSFQTIVLYLTTTVIASVIGLLSVLAFQSFFIEGEFDTQGAAYIALGCTEEGSLLMEDPTDGSIVCTPNGNETSPYAQFEIMDLTGTFARTDGTGFEDISMSDTIYSGVFMKLITDNVFLSFMEGNFAAVVIFAIVFGIALGRIFFEQNEENNKEGQDSVASTAQLVVHFFQGIGDILLRMINWIIA
jgi:Na+/H+-dicarboxylate symporter